MGAYRKKSTVSLADTATVAGAIATSVIPVAASSFAVANTVMALLRKYNSLPVNKNIAPVNSVSDTWKSRPKANLVKWLMKESGTSLETVAAHIGCSVSYLNNKLTRESFSFEDLLLAAYACGYTFALIKNDVELENSALHRVDLLEHFNNDPDVLKRINIIEEKTQKVKREEYEKKKAELDRLRKEYGFED